MSKKSPEPEDDRLPTDGAIPTIDLSPLLGEEGGGGPIGEDSLPEQMTFALADVRKTALERLVVGQRVVFSRQGRRIAATTERTTVGYVPTSHLQRVRLVMDRDVYDAWASDVGHRAVSVTVEW